MKAKFFWIVLAGCLMSAGTVNAQRDTTRTDRNYPLNEVVVTGVRHETDIRHLSQTVSVVGRPTIEWIDIWVRGENLLAQKYEINAGYPMPRATVMAGFNINL